MQAEYVVMLSLVLTDVLSWPASEYESCPHIQCQVVQCAVQASEHQQVRRKNMEAKVEVSVQIKVKMKTQGQIRVKVQKIVSILKSFLV